MSDNVGTLQTGSVGAESASADAAKTLTADEVKTEKDAKAMQETSDFDDVDIVHDVVDENAPDGWSYEVPRPWLSIEQAAFMLGRSPLAVERSIAGKWGNKLPEGWSARRVIMDGVEEWRIVPPPGFRIKHSRPEKHKETGEPGHESEDNIDIADVDASPLTFDPSADEHEVGSHGEESPKAKTKSDSTKSGSETKTKAEAKSRTEARSAAKTKHRDSSKVKSKEGVQRTSVDEETKLTGRGGDSMFSLGNLLHSAGQMAQKELASFGLAVRSEKQDDVEHATIVIDRSDEVEKLLRELADTRKELAEQTRMHLDDLRVMQEMQSSMRLLEVNSRETAELKQDLCDAQKALIEHKRRYEQFVALPWWKKIFSKLP